MEKTINTNILTTPDFAYDKKCIAVTLTFDVVAGEVVIKKVLDHEGHDITDTLTINEERQLLAIAADHA